MLNNNSKVLEIGCGEGGNLLCFAELGCQCVGIDLNKPKIDAGRKIFEDTEYKDTVSFIDDDIYNREAEYRNAFDVILLKDVIEHIHDQQKLINFMKLMLKPNGVIFFAFPPWYMPFGGHQQVMSKKIPSLTPFTHLLPMPLYKGYLKLMGESKQGVENLAEIKDTGISIERFERCVKKSGMEIKFKKLYFINPNYKWKFGLKPKRVWPALTHIPFLKNFYTTTAYYMVGTKA
jgi:SAM-dependent methyltransferase